MSELDTAPPILTANCARIAPPAGHYSHVCVAAGLAHVSGQLPVSALASRSPRAPSRNRSARCLPISTAAWRKPA
ncbi:hypothetical protein KTD28_29085 [Burkholderia gladioli]|nr:MULTISPECIES: hypothetical protein [Burkholderia]TWC96102.1 hypothetical protein FBX98_119134 [Burkholderia sp. SJZ115]TWD00074.1 hypothetical protein FB601_117134 [Burkholderia sp. SJZ091]MBJ9661941.1 hypothetical protein [Burkholderia gladioli]MBJ9714799.1 hypothetical protein [Burkholderia gladioli]MBU9158660.1 hypothetical protein [Burkholderia gladioli]